MSSTLTHVVRAPRPIVVVGVVAALVLVGVLWQSSLSLLILLTDGAIAAGVVLAATGGGLWIVKLLGLANAPLRWQLLLAAALGLGGLALATLGLGVVGVLRRIVWLAILSAGGLAGFAYLARLRQRPPTPTENPHTDALHWLWLVAAPFFAMWVLVCVVPPGFLWAEEGWGYDVLEYHLELPKEYFQAGRIMYVPHNVYANFPSNIEMLSLICMVLRGNFIAGAASAKILNAGFAALFVAAAWLAGRETSPRAGIVAGVVAAGLGYITYFAGIAFVENGMLFLGMMSVAAILRAQRDGANPREATRWMLAAGLLGGLCAGCKYTAVALVVIPAFVLIVLGRPARRPGVMRETLVFAMGAAATFAPWLIKNVAMTGNPVFPLMNTVFHASPPGWGQAETAHFNECHSPTPEDRPLTARLARLWERVPADHFGRYGPLIFILAAGAVLARRPSRSSVALLLMLIVQVAIWLFATHLYARFAVPIVIPLIALAGRVIDARTSSAWRWTISVAIVAGTALNFANIACVYHDHFYINGTRVEPAGAASFFTDGLGMGHEYLAIVNHDLPPNAKILLVGDAKAFYFLRPVDYCVVFNRNPFVEEVRHAASPGEIVAWLQSHGYTQVLVNWAEIKRLRNSTYGFPPEITPELFERLMAAGLVHHARIVTATDGVPFADLFDVPPRRPTSAPRSRSSR